MSKNKPVWEHDLYNRDFIEYTPRYNRQYIADSVGLENWHEVESIYGGKTVAEIEKMLDELYPGEDNHEFALELWERL